MCVPWCEYPSSAGAASGGGAVMCPCCWGHGRAHISGAPKWKHGMEWKFCVLSRQRLWSCLCCARSVWTSDPWGCPLSAFLLDGADQQHSSTRPASARGLGYLVRVAAFLGSPQVLWENKVVTEYFVKFPLWVLGVQVLWDAALGFAGENAPWRSHFFLGISFGRERRFLPDFRPEN